MNRVKPRKSGLNFQIILLRRTDILHKKCDSGKAKNEFEN